MLPARPWSMFLREALLRCSQLEEEIATVYSELAASGAVPGSVPKWEEAANREKARARLLHALAELTTALDDDGPFLVQVPVQLTNLRRVVDSVRGRVVPAIDAPTAARCADALETTQRAELHAGLLEVAEPEIRRLLKLIDTETRSVRRAAGEGSRPRSAVRSRDTARIRGACAQTAS